jgi:hypothetical protein
MSEIWIARRVVDKTAPWGRPEGIFLGVEDTPFR